MKTLFRKYWVRWSVALLLTILACLQIAVFPPSTWLARLDVFLYDMRMQFQDGSLDPRVVIVDIDEKSIDAVGRWPWSRDVIARLISRLDQDYFVKSIGFDVIFSEPDTSSGYQTLEALANREFRHVEGFRERVRELKPAFDYDQHMAEAMRGRPVVLGYFMSNEPGALTKGLLPKPAFGVEDLGGRRVEANTYASYTANLELLQQAAKGGGFMNPTPDPDGAIRRLPLLARIGDHFYESLALATARVGLGATTVQPVFYTEEELMLSGEAYLDYGAINGLLLNSRPQATFVPTERKLTALINYRGPGGPRGGQFRYVSAVDVLEQKVPLDVLADRFVLVGTTSAGLKDLRSSPVNIDYPGVEMHANVIASILDGKFKQEPDDSKTIQILQVVAIGLVLGIALPMLSPLMSIVLALAGTSAAIGVNLLLYHSYDMVVPLAIALLLGAGLFVFNLAWGYLFEYRKGRAMVNLFGEYVAPELVQVMAQNPENYSMEGESRELTVMFSDVRGFTTISEGLDPNELREYINRYLTAVSEDIRGNRGTLDKYIGDAVMAFWGAPVTLPDHAERAVATALKMQQTARMLNKEFAERNWPPLNIGIGLNTGEMRVGDMGSKLRRAYTVMGDAVNLASRLEGITKVYGVGVVVGAGTKQAAPRFAYRELDRVRVKGKNEPVPVFEPVGLEAELGADERNRLDQWHAALEMVRAQRWDEAEQAIRALMQDDPSRPLYALYLERIARYRIEPPGQDWDGVTTFDTK